MLLKPAYLRYILILQGLIMLVAVMWWLGAILVPFAFAGVLAVLLNPMNEWLLRRRVPRLVAISVTVLIALVVVVGLLYFLVLQVADFADEIPTLQKRLNEYLAQSQNFFRKELHVSSRKQMEYVNKGLDKALADGGGIAVSILGALSDMAVNLTLIPVYVFLILLYKPTLVLFLRQIFAETGDKKVGEILTEVKSVIQSYISGLLIEAAIVSAMNVVGLMLLGIPYALLMGVIGGLLNMIPYIGGIIAIALPMLIALITMQDGLTSALLVVLAYSIIQFLDNNLIQPKIVASKVRINALFTILVVLAGNMLWGVGGMFLSIPILAVLKIVFDRVEDLKPWGMLFGDQIPGVDEKPSMNEKRKTIAD